MALSDGLDQTSSYQDQSYNQREGFSLHAIVARMGLRRDIERGGESAIAFLNRAIPERGSRDQNTFYIATKSERDQTFTLLLMKRVGDKIFEYTSPTKQRFQITFREGVGVNQRFSTVLPSGYRIYGISFPVTTAYAGTYKSGMPYSYVSYIPYETMLDTPEKRRIGVNYLQSSFRQAYEKIKSADLRSQAFPGKKVHEVIPYWLPLLFNIVEHMDSDIYIGSREKKQLKPRDEVWKMMSDKMGEVFNQYANNGRSTYNYSLSGTGALGTAQMMRAPYEKLVKDFYPKAGLNPDFILGMQDHTNAMMAQILWFDDILKTFPDNFKEDYLRFVVGKSQRSDILGILGASYNKGTSISSDLRKGKNWKDIFNELPIESQIYFHKTRYVRQELQLRYGIKHIPESPNHAKVGLSYQDAQLIEGANKRIPVKKGKSEKKVSELERERREMVLRPAYDTYLDIANGIKTSKLILVPEKGLGYELIDIGMYELDSAKKNLLRALDPPTFRLLEEIARKYDMKFPGRRLPITSLARPQDYYDKIPSRGNHKAADGKTSHMHGLSFDIGIGRMKPEEVKWLNIELKGLKDKKIILTALEGRNAMHVFLRPVENVRAQK